MNTSSWYPELYEESNSWEQYDLPTFDPQVIKEDPNYAFPLILGICGVFICGSMICRKIQNQPNEQNEQLL